MLWWEMWIGKGMETVEAALESVLRESGWIKGVEKGALQVGLQGGLAGKRSCHQAGQPELTSFRTHLTKGENWLLYVVCQPPCVCHDTHASTYPHLHPNKETNAIKYFYIYEREKLRK